jgi:hypothetical protein
MELVALIVVVLIVIGVPLFDRLTDAPVMRRDVNAGTNRWRMRERLRKKEDIGFSLETLDDYDAEERRSRRLQR